MSLFSTIEIAIQVEHFKNIDLYNQGFYRWDFKMYYMNEDTRFFAKPVAIKVSDVTKKKRKLWKEVTIIYMFKFTIFLFFIY